jgi:hypothetical protein
VNPVTDTMNNLYANSGLKPKYIIADIDTYKKSYRYSRPTDRSLSIQRLSPLTRGGS